MKEKKIINPHEARIEADYLEMERLGIKLGIPVPQVHFTLEVHKDGKLISHYKQRSHTWNRNFWNWLIAVLTYTPGVATNFGAGYLSFKRHTGAVTAVGSSALYANCVGPINNSLYGIQVGIGTAAEDFEGYALSNQCVEGSGANQLVHAAHSALVQNYVSGTKTWTITIKRLFNNNSGSDIVIAECALTYMNGLTYDYIFNRDLLAGTQTVANGGQLTASYAISLVFPA